MNRLAKCQTTRFEDEDDKHLGGGGELPFRACLVANVIETQVMHHQGGPIAFSELSGNMPCHILIYFHKVLR